MPAAHPLRARSGSWVRVSVRLGVAGLAVLVLAAVCAQGWPSPAHQDPVRAAFQTPGDRHIAAGRPRVTGWFESTGAAEPLSEAAVFGGGRFACGGGAPLQRDGQSAASGGRALRFLPPGDEEWGLKMSDRAADPDRAARSRLLAATAAPGAAAAGTASVGTFNRRADAVASFEAAGPAFEAGGHGLIDDMVAVLARHELRWRAVTLGGPLHPSQTGGAS